MAFDATRTVRGALAGAVAAGVWAAQQPLDKRAFGLAYDDVEILGRFAVRGGGPAWYPAGLALHLANGAVFGALYANVAPSLKGPAWARGVSAGVAEGVATWPATALVDVLHPERDRFPQLWGSSRAFAQATWRHALFGAVLGTLERRLNPPAEVPPAAPDAGVVATNGHGGSEHLVVVESA